MRWSGCLAACFILSACGGSSSTYQGWISLGGLGFGSQVGLEYSASSAVFAKGSFSAPSCAQPPCACAYASADAGASASGLGSVSSFANAGTLTFTDGAGTVQWFFSPPSASDPSGYLPPPSPTFTWQA